MGKHAVSVSLGITYCVVTVAWGFALVKMVAWLSTGMPPLAHSVRRVDLFREHAGAAFL